MANFNNNRGGQKKVNTTTKVVTVFNQSGDDAGALQLGYWNNLATLAIAPLLPAKKNQDASYDFENAPSVVLNSETIVTLQHGVALLQKDVAKEAGKINYVAVETMAQGEAYRVEVGYKQREIDGYYVAIILLDKNDDEADVMVFPFDFEEGDRNQTLFIGTAKKEIVRSIDTQFKTFVKYLELSATFLNVGHAQGANINTDWKNSRLEYSIELIKGLMESNIVGGGGGRGRGGDDGDSGRRSGGFGSGRRRGGNNNSGGGRGGRGGDSEEGGSSRGGGRGRGQRTGGVKEQTSNDINDIEGEMEEVNIDDMD